MKESEEALEPVFDAPTEEVGRMVAAFLEKNGIRAFFREVSGLAFDGVETLWSGQDAMKVFVLAEDAGRARELVESYMESIEDSRDGGSS